MSNTIPKSMKAAVVMKGTEPLQIRTDFPVPEPAHGEILIKVLVAGVCHSDVLIHKIHSGKTPLVMGHEGVGVVVKLGPGVKNLQVGDIVGSPFLHETCGACEHCLSGNESVCTFQKKQTGSLSDGSFAEYTIANADFVARIPPSLSLEQAAPIMCAGVTVYKGLKETEVRPGQWVAIVGASGGLGHLAVQYAKVMGMKVIAVENGKERVEYCTAHGAIGVDASEPNFIENVKQITNGGPHGVLVVAPAIPAYEAASRYLRPRGVLVGVGLPLGEIKVPTLDFVIGRKTIRGTLVGSRLDLQEALDIAASAGIRSDIRVRKLEDINEVLTDLDQYKIKGRVVIGMAKL